MKTLFHLLITACSTYIICGCTHPETNQVAGLVDITDQHILHPDSALITEHFALKKDRWAGATFSLATISDVGYNPRHECSIASASSLFGNLRERNKEVGQFWNCYTSAWNLLNDTVGRERSSVYLPIVRELERLVASTATTKTLLVYSDLQEHSSVFSVHDKQDIVLLENDPGAALAKLSAKAPLPESLAGISIYFIYQPMNPLDDERFSLMAHLLRDAFTKHGASVTISGSLHLAHH